MRKLLAYYILLLCTVLAYGKVNDPELEKILNKHVEAMGGRAAMGDIRTLMIDGLMEEAAKRVLVARKRPNLVRINILDDKERLIVGYDGKETWVVLEVRGNRLKPEGVDASGSNLERFSFFWLPPSDFENPDYRFRRLEDTVVNGKENYTMEVKIAGFTGHEVYCIDKETFMITKREIIPENDQDTTVYLSAYRLIAGVRMPHIMTTITGKKKSIMEVRSIKVNEGLYSSYFEAP